MTNGNIVYRKLSKKDKYLLLFSVDGVDSLIWRVMNIHNNQDNHWENENDLVLVEEIFNKGHPLTEIFK